MNLINDATTNTGQQKRAFRHRIHALGKISTKKVVRQTGNANLIKETIV